MAEVKEYVDTQDAADQAFATAEAAAAQAAAIAASDPVGSAAAAQAAAIAASDPVGSAAAAQAAAIAASDPVGSAAAAQAAAIAASDPVGSAAAAQAAAIAASVPAANGPIARATLPADSQLTNPNVETAHTAISLPAAAIGTARRTVRLRARLRVDGRNGADTFRVRLYVGTIGGAQLLWDSGAQGMDAGNQFDINAMFSIRTVGAGGTFSGLAEGQITSGGGAQMYGAVDAGAINTTGAVDLTVSSLCSADNAANIISLQHLEYEVLGA